jgi:uncharacterized protein
MEPGALAAASADSLKATMLSRDVGFYVSFAGGIMVGLAAALLLWGTGRLAGVSGIAGGLLPVKRGDWEWRALFIGGLVAGGLVLRWLQPQALGTPPGTPLVLALAGLLVGFGTRLGGGCTSGHGVCGVGRLSRRSLVAVLVFMLTGAVTVALMPGAGGAP